MGALQAPPATAGPLSAFVPPVTSSRRRWPLIGCVLAVLAIQLIGLGGYLLLAWNVDRDHDAAVAETELLDPRWRFADILADRPPIPDEANPAVIVKQVDDLLRPTRFDIGQKNWQLFEEPDSVHRLNGPQSAVLREVLAKHDAAVKLARTLKDRTGEGRFVIRVDPSFVNTNFDPLHRCRGVMNLLQFDAMLRADNEDMAGAMQSCRALLTTTRAIGDEPYLIAALIRFAGEAIAVNTLERVLAQGEPPAEELAAMQDLLVKELAAPILFQAMRGERGGFDEVIKSLQKGNIKLSVFMGGGGPGPTRWEDRLLDMFPAVVTRGRGEHLRMMNQAVEAAKLPAEKQAEAFAKLDQAVRAHKTIMVRMLVPAVGKVSEASRRNKANLSCAIVGVAAERYRLKHEHWPDSLDALVQDHLLDTIPIDPFGGQPLRFKALPDGIVVYSLGFDGVDNGGNINRSNPMQSGTDLGFRLWEVTGRRQPSLPPPLDDGGR